MAKRKYTIAGAFPAYDTAPGETVTLDPADPGVQANLAAGVLIVGAEKTASKPPVMTCPACVEQSVKKPPTFADADALAKHYQDEHPALVTPPFSAEEE